jgi:hypothetical protein
MEDGLYDPDKLNGGVLPPGSQPYGSQHTSYENSTNQEFRKGQAYFSQLGLRDHPSSPHGDGVPTPDQLAVLADRNTLLAGSAWDFAIPASATPSTVPTCLSNDAPAPPGLLQQHVVTFPFPARGLPAGDVISRSVVASLPMVPLRNPRLVYYELTPFSIVFENQSVQPYTTAVAFGLSTLPYPDFRLPGW